MIRGRRTSGQGGFTLVEMLLSVALLALVFGVFGGLLFRLERTGTRISNLEAAESLSVVRRFIVASLEGSRTLPGLPVGRRRAVHFDGAAQRVTFAAVAAGDRETGGLYEITLQMGGEGQLVLLRRRLGWGGGRPLPPRVLLRGVASLAFTYSPCPSRSGNSALQSWSGRDHLPYLISMRVTFTAGDARTWPELSVFPEASACPLAG